MTRYTQVITNDDGWSDWIQPVMENYKMSCCDCGLVHALDFRIENDRVQFRASRAVRATAAKRLWRRRQAAQTEQTPTPTHQT